MVSSTRRFPFVVLYCLIGGHLVGSCSTPRIGATLEQATVRDCIVGDEAGVLKFGKNYDKEQLARICRLQLASLIAEMDLAGLAVGEPGTPTYNGIPNTPDQHAAYLYLKNYSDAVQDAQKKHYVEEAAIALRDWFQDKAIDSMMEGLGLAVSTELDFAFKVMGLLTSGGIAEKPNLVSNTIANTTDINVIDRQLAAAERGREILQRTGFWNDSYVAALTNLDALISELQQQHNWLQSEGPIVAARGNSRSGPAQETQSQNAATGESDHSPPGAGGKGAGFSSSLGGLFGGGGGGGSSLGAAGVGSATSSANVGSGASGASGGGAGPGGGGASVSGPGGGARNASPDGRIHIDFNEHQVGTIQGHADGEDHGGEDHGGEDHGGEDHGGEDHGGS